MCSHAARGWRKGAFAAWQFKLVPLTAAARQQTLQCVRFIKAAASHCDSARRALHAPGEATGRPQHASRKDTAHALTFPCILQVFGVGGGGSNAVNNMVNSGSCQGVEFWVANTDVQVSLSTSASYSVQGHCCPQLLHLWDRKDAQLASAPSCGTPQTAQNSTIWTPMVDCR